MPPQYSVIFAVLLLLSGCGGLQTTRYFSPSLAHAEQKIERWGDGLAFKANSMCIWVAEGGSKDYRLLAAGPIGLPIIPFGVLDSKHDRPGYFDLVLWFVPDQNTRVYSFDPGAPSIEFETDEKIKPSVVQVSRFKTHWEKETVYAFRPDTVERIYYPEHWGGKPTKDFTEPVELWDWSRFTMRFEKPTKTSVPSVLLISGIKQDGKEIPVSTIHFKEIEETRYLYSGRTADNTRMGDSPATACRSLFKHETQQP